MTGSTYSLSALQRSETFKKYIGKVGICTQCQEPASVFSPCCNAPVDYEGARLTAEELWNRVEIEMKEGAK